MDSNITQVYPVPASYPAGTYTIPDSTVTAVITSHVFACPYELHGTSTTTVVHEVKATAYVTATKGVEDVPVVKAPEAPGPEAPEAPKVPETPSSPPSQPPSGGPITNGNKWAMTYTPYTTDGGCKDASSVLSDLAVIKSKGFTTVRMYGTDCSGLSTVGAACAAHGLQLILGVFVKGDGIGAARPQIGEIIEWGSQGSNWGMVTFVVVGNECIHSGACDGPSLAGFIGEMKTALQGAGAGHIPVTTTETVATFVANAATLCPVIDIVGANIQSFFDGKVLAHEAGSFVASQLQQVADACPGKPTYNLESGWPSGGSDNGASVASPEAQGAAIADIVAKVGKNTVVFSFQDDAWKPAGIEQHFGCANQFA